jgi:hypothetical protein
MRILLLPGNPDPSSEAYRDAATQIFRFSELEKGNFSFPSFFFFFFFFCLKFLKIFKFFIGFFFIYISNVFPFLALPSETPYPILPHPTSMRVLPHPPSSCPGIPLHRGIEHPQDQGPLLPLMSTFTSFYLFLSTLSLTLWVS